MSAAFDRSLALARLGGDEALLADIIRLFHRESARARKALAEAIEARDRETVAREAHKLRGSAGSLGATPLMEIAETLEIEATEEDEGWDAIDRVWARVVVRWDELDLALDGAA